MTTHLLVAHGSPDPRHARAVFDLAGRLTVRGVTAEVAFLGHDEPSLAAWLARPNPARSERGRVPVLGLFLAPGQHAEVDLRRAVASAASSGRPVVDRGALGLGPWLEPVLGDLVRAAGGEPESPLLLVTAGSTWPAAQIAAERFGRRLARARGASVSVVHSPQEIRAAARAGAGHQTRATVVVPLLLAPGVLADRVRRAADAAGLATTGTLTASDELSTVVIARSTPVKGHC